MDAQGTAADVAPGRSGARPLRRDAELNRQRVLAAAQEVFAAQGLSASLHDVAAHAGVGVGTVYRRYPDKEALIDDALAERVSAVAEVVGRAQHRGTAWDGLVEVFTSMIAMNAANRGLRDLLFSAGHAQRSGERMREEVMPLLQALVDRAHQEGSLRADATLTDVVLSQVMLTELAHHGAVARPTAYTRLVTVVLDGLRAQPEPTPMTEVPVAFADAEEIMRAWVGARPASPHAPQG